MRDCLDNVFERLTAAAIFHGHGADAWGEAVALVCYVLKLPLDKDFSPDEITVTDAACLQINTLLEKRIEERIPMAYITGEMWFMGLPFYIDQRVLIPRSPFGEWIERQFTPWVNPSDVKQILEIGTGSGCMAIAASYAFPEARIDAIDISLDALAVAKQNIEKHQASDRVSLIESDCFAALPNDRRYDIIMSNPPYVSQAEVDDLPAEYHHEPVQTALYAAGEGLAIVDKILRDAPAYLSEHGILVVEVGYSDAALVSRYPEVPFTWLECEHGGQGLFVLTKQQLEQINVR